MDALNEVKQDAEKSALRHAGMRGIVHTLAGQAVRFAVQIASLVVLARLLSPTDFGLVAMIMALIGVAVVIGDAGLSLAALQARELTRGQRDTLFWINVAMGASLTTSVWFLAPLIEAFYGRDDLTSLCRALGFIFLLNSISVQYRVQLSRELRFRSVATIEATSQVLALIAAVAAAVAGLGHWALAIQQLAVPATTAIGFILFCRWLPRRPRRHVGIKGFLKFGTNTMAVQVLNYLSTSIPASLLGRAAGAHALGEYNRAYSLFTLPMTQLAAPITRVAIPILSRIDRRDRLQATLIEAQRVITYTLCMIFGIAAALAPAAIPLILGSQWSESGDIFAILAIGGIFQALAYSYYWAYVSMGRTGTQLLTMIPARLAMIIFCAALLPFGAKGVAAGLAIGLATIWLVGSTVGMRLIGINSRPIVGLSAPPAFTIAAFVIIARFADSRLPPSTTDANRLLFCAMIITAVIFAAWLLVPRIREDLRMVAQTVSKARRRRT